MPKTQRQRLPSHTEAKVVVKLLPQSSSRLVSLAFQFFGTALPLSLQRIRSHDSNASLGGLRLCLQCNRAQAKHSGMTVRPVTQAGVSVDVARRTVVHKVSAPGVGKFFSAGEAAIGVVLAGQQLGPSPQATSFLAPHAVPRARGHRGPPKKRLVSCGCFLSAGPKRR